MNKLQYLWKEIKDTIKVYSVVYSRNKKIVSQSNAQTEAVSKESEKKKDAISIQDFGQPYKINEDVKLSPVNLEITLIENEEIQFERPGYPPHAKVDNHEYHIVISDGKGNTINEKFSPQGKFRGWNSTPQSRFFDNSDTLYLCVFDVDEARQKVFGRSEIVSTKKNSKITS